MGLTSISCRENQVERISVVANVSIFLEFGRRENKTVLRVQRGAVEHFCVYKNTDFGAVEINS